MKQLFFILAAALVFSACTSTDKPSTVDKDKAIKDTANYTTIQWLDSTEQNVGKVDAGQVVEISWHFKNSGNKPLVVANVRPGCGCTGAEGPEEPIAPGKEGVIKAKFDSKNFQGTQHKQVYVMANDHNKNSDGQDILNFIVDVVPKK
ncbi:MAG: DUF1573 domain-containing protein [Flavisolibacter sp.]|jgi:hypothetical protein